MVIGPQNDKTLQHDLVITPEFCILASDTFSWVLVGVGFFFLLLVVGWFFFCFGFLFCFVLFSFHISQ